MAIGDSFKERLMGALHSAVGHFNEGMRPDDAVVKAASDLDFNPDQTNALIAAFNTARTIYHYKTASDRTVNFELADPAVVMQRFYAARPEVRKAASVGTYGQYDEREIDYRDNMEVEKGGAHQLAVSVTDYPDQDLDALGRSAMKMARVYHQLADTTRDEGRIAGLKAQEIVQKVAAALQYGWEDVVRDRYGRVLAAYAKQAGWEPVMERLQACMPAWLHKQAAAECRVVQDADLSPVREALKEARVWMEAEAEMLATSGVMDKIASDMEIEWLAAANLKVAEAPEASLSDFLKVGAEPKAPPKGPAAPKKPSGDFLSQGIASGLADGVKGTVGKQLESGLDAALNAPQERENKAMSDRLRNVQRQIMLEDLISTDPVLSDESPDVVTKAYQSIMSIAPDLSANKEIVRAILRQAVHSVAVSPYEAQTWAQLEKDIRTIAGKMPTPAKQEARR